MNTWILIFFTAATGLSPDSMYQFKEDDFFPTLQACEQAGDKRTADNKASYLCIEDRR